MKYDMILLRYGELTIKGRNRNRFERAIYQHVKTLLYPFSRVKISQEYGRLYIELNGEPLSETIQVLKHVFGVVSLSPIKRVSSEFTSIGNTCIQCIHELEPSEGTTFKVSAKRVWKKFMYSSQELNQRLGAEILRTCKQVTVNVKQPNIELRVEVKADWTYIYYEVIAGTGGFPLASNGRAMLLLSGGIDSPVAGYEALRKGLALEVIHFHSYPFTSKRSQQKVLALAQLLANYAGQLYVHFVPFIAIQTELYQTQYKNITITLMRRAMLRLATELAMKRHALALVTGDSLGQVASQTLGSMNVIGRATMLPLLRPLITVDKNDIIRMAQAIGTYDLSISPYEDCCTLFMPQNPTTNPNLKIVERVEGTFTQLDQLIQTAIEQSETLLLQAGGTTIVSDDEMNKKKLPFEHQHIIKAKEVATVPHREWF